MSHSVATLQAESPAVSIAKSARPSVSYTVTAARSADAMKPEILRLMRDNFSWSQQADVWHHWAYEQSPYRPNYCWFVETEDQETVGFTALMPRRMKVAERVCDVGQAANLNVQAEHRGTAAAIKLQRALISHVEEGDLALAFGITRNAVAVQRRAGDRDLGTFSRWIKLFRTEHKLRGRIPWTWPRQTVAGLVDAALRLRARETWLRMPRGWQVQHDLPFDALWEAAAPRFGIATERSSAYLNWRYRLDPQLKYRTLAVHNERGELRSDAIYQFRDPEESLPFGATVDVMAVDPQSAHVVPASLSSHLRRLAATGVQMPYFGSPLIEEALQRCGYFRRSSDVHLMAHLHPSLEPREAKLLAPACWLPSAGT